MLNELDSLNYEVIGLLFSCYNNLGRSETYYEIYSGIIRTFQKRPNVIFERSSVLKVIELSGRLCLQKSY